VDGNEAVKCRINLVDGDGVIRVFQQTGCEGVLLVPNATLWWPIFMHPSPGHLYLFEVIKFNADFTHSNIDVVNKQIFLNIDVEGEIPQEIIFLFKK
jgi:hypothetical protein